MIGESWERILATNNTSLRSTAATLLSPANPTLTTLQAQSHETSRFLPRDSARQFSPAVFADLCRATKGHPLALDSKPASLDAGPPPDLLPLLQAGYGPTLVLKVVLLAALALLLMAVAPGHAQIGPSTLGNVGPVDWGDAITTTSCRLTDKSRIGNGGGVPAQVCRH